MFPWIRTGDYVFVRRYSMEMVKPGEVVLFEREGRLFVHRVLRGLQHQAGAKTPRTLITKGDALEREDAPVSQAEFLGRVTRVHRGQRHIDLESLGQVALGRFLALISRRTFLIYLPFIWIKRRMFG